MKPIIKVQNVSKQYQIGTVRQTYPTLRDSLINAAKVPFNWRERGSRSRTETLWALKDISFEVQPGEILGIIGRNGAGKSTLLKILSRITEPTTGRIELYGRIGSLLEVGTGFHPELSGRENIYLNGAFLGMSRREISRKFDEIVAFAEVERFIDTPVKHFSSGMYLRLAFAVAAHLDPEILIVDEVLAVGDARFQRKCLDKMQDVGRLGRTVLFVSHNMAAITRLCSRAILIDDGSVVVDKWAHETVAAYMGTGTIASSVREWKDRSVAPGNDIVRLGAVRVRNDRGEISDALDIRLPVAIEIDYTVLKSGQVLVPNLSFHNEEGVCVFMANDLNRQWRATPRPAGTYRTTVWIPGNLLAEGTLFVGAAVSTMNPVVVHFYERDVVAFRIIDSLDGDSARGEFAGAFPGVIRPALQWETEQFTDAKSEAPVTTELYEVSR